MRVKASTGNQANKNTTFVWDTNRLNPSLVRELDGNGSMIREYQYGNDVVSMVSGNSTYYFHRDGLGDVLNVTSSSGVTQWTYTYNPFGGARTATKNSNQAPNNPILFAGAYQESSGNYYLQARRYDPLVGRFTTVDPAAARQNLPYVASYAYVRNNPALYTDPSGLGPDCAQYIGLGAMSGLGAGAALGTAAEPGGGTLVLGGTGLAVGTLGGTVAAGVCALGSLLLGNGGGGGTVITPLPQPDLRPAPPDQGFFHSPKGPAGKVTALLAILASLVLTRGMTGGQDLTESEGSHAYQ